MTYIILQFENEKKIIKRIRKSCQPFFLLRRLNYGIVSIQRTAVYNKLKILLK